jgi:hypothetical protein
MVNRVRCLLLIVLLFAAGRAWGDARFDLVGPKIDMRVTRGGETLDIAQVPNLQPGDKLWLHPDLPSSQSVKYLLICVFLRGTTNPPPDDWFIRIETWDKHVRQEGTFITVPAEATQAVLLLAPETGGDFSTLKSAVRGRPGVFVRADQDLIEAGFEQARIEKYLASIRRVPPSDTSDLQKRSDLLARTLALKPNDDCFKRPIDTQFTCLTQTGTQTLLDDGHGQSIVSALSNGSGSDFINAASYTSVAGAGLYSAYVGAIVDLIRIMGNLHTARYQYIPAIAFPQGPAMNLRLNTPPSFLNPKSVLVIGLPAVQKAIPPPLRPADADHVSCLLKPAVTLPIEGAPLVFSTSFAHDVVLHLNVPAGAPAEDDIPLVPDPYHGGLVLQHGPQPRKELHDELKAKPVPVKLDRPDAPRTDADKDAAKPADPIKPQPEPVLLTGVITGYWGFDPFTGPTVQLQQRPGENWHIVRGSADSSIIAGKTAQFLLSSSGTACVHAITAKPAGSKHELTLDFKPQPAADESSPEDLAVTLPLEQEQTPGDLHLSIQQYSQPKADELAARTFAEPAKVTAIDLHAGDKTVLLTGSGLGTITSIKLGDLVYKPQPSSSDTSLRLELPADASAPPIHAGDHLNAEIALNDGRTFSEPVLVTTPRPSISLLSKTAEPATDPIITLTNADDLPLTSRITFTVKSQQPFPRDGQIEVETLDGTLHATLTLAPAGGLLLQDPHTVVATLDPSRSFGPSAFGALHIRADFPPHHGKDESKQEENEIASSDWIPLVTLVRLPVFSTLQCSAETSQPCTLSGANFFLLQALSTDPAFATPQAVPDGFTGLTLSVPHPIAGNTLFFKLRDDPQSVVSANVPEPTPSPTTASGHTHSGQHGTHTAAAKTTSE